MFPIPRITSFGVVFTITTSTSFNINITIFPPIGFLLVLIAVGVAWASALSPFILMFSWVWVTSGASFFFLWRGYLFKRLLNSHLSIIIAICTRGYCYASTRINSNSRRKSNRITIMNSNGRAQWYFICGDPPSYWNLSVIEIPRMRFNCDTDFVCYFLFCLRDRFSYRNHCVVLCTDRYFMVQWGDLELAEIQLSCLAW